eukprot:Hpha_TRINITY_DN15957_c1_g1::TRINITY_DN15957_c1_g1_i1::g.73188::m.73188
MGRAAWISLMVSTRGVLEVALVSLESMRARSYKLTVFWGGMAERQGTSLHTWNCMSTAPRACPSARRSRLVPPCSRSSPKIWSRLARRVTARRIWSASLKLPFPADWKRLMSMVSPTATPEPAPPWDTVGVWMLVSSTCGRPGMGSSVRVGTANALVMSASEITTGSAATTPATVGSVNISSVKAAVKGAAIWGELLGDLEGEALGEVGESEGKLVGAVVGPPLGGAVSGSSGVITSTGAVSTSPTGAVSWGASSGVIAWGATLGALSTRSSRGASSAGGLSGSITTMSPPMSTRVGENEGTTSEPPSSSLSLLDRTSAMGALLELPFPLLPFPLFPLFDRTSAIGALFELPLPLPLSSLLLLERSSAIGDLFAFPFPFGLGAPASATIGNANNTTTAMNDLISPYPC